MQQQKKSGPLNIIEYSKWVASQKFKNPEEHHMYVSYEEQNFLQFVIYPMFYAPEYEHQIKQLFPYVLKDYSSYKPKYVIDNNHFTLVFFSYDNYDNEICWEVSMHIKDYDFCEKRIHEFTTWFLKHYRRPFSEFVTMKEMPEEFKYPELDLYAKEVQDFSFEFWNETRDFMLFKLMDILRLF